MHPELFTFPESLPWPVGGMSVKTYGFCMAVGFLTAVWIAIRRARRLKANPDRILDMAFWALIFGVGGARAFFVIHYWETDFATLPNPWVGVFTIWHGGFEFLGGLLGASLAILVYLWRTRQSMRLYLDIAAPSAMWGLAIGRLGCFFNGCCFGAVCVAGPGEPAQVPWAVEFPYGSPPHYRQWEDRQVSVPMELLTPHGMLIRPEALNMPVERRRGPEMELENVRAILARQSEGDADAAALEELRRQEKLLEDKVERFEAATGIDAVRQAQRYPSRRNPDRQMSLSELQELAAHSHSLAVHPSQLYAAINAALLSVLLAAVLSRRKRHGVVFGLLFVLYPITRIILEAIRADNRADTLGLTISQFVSVVMILIGVIYLWVVYTKLPERSPLAVYEPPQDSGKNKNA